ncbi:MAG: hypothetical protein K6G11_01095 [Lachnospiraceae bacterium]|nr:hypothetical protein [Lachnospiraceae bacterium]
MKKLSDFIKRNHTQDFEIREFSNISSLKNYLNTEKNKQTKNLELIISDDLKFTTNKAACVYLIEDPDSINASENNKVINKYQSIEIIIKQLYDIVSEKELNRNTNTFIGISNLKIVTFIHPAIFSSGISKIPDIIDQYNIENPSLLIDLTYFSGLTTVLAGDNIFENPNDTSEFIFYIKRRKPDIPNKIKAISKNYKNLNVITGVNDPREILEITTDDIKHLIMNLSSNIKKGHTCYFLVNTFTDATLWLLKNSTYVYYVINDNSYLGNEKALLNETSKLCDYINKECNKDLIII